MAQSSQTAVRKAIQNALNAGKKKNPQFSLRGLSLKLGVSAGALSEILAGKRQMSVALKNRILKKLDSLDQENSDLLNIESRFKGAGLPCEWQFAPDEEMWRSWIPIGILGILSLPERHISARTIATRLNVSKETVEKYLSLLKSLDLVKTDADGVWVPTGTLLRSAESLTAAVWRERFLETLKEIAHHIKSQDDFVGYTSLICIDPEKLPEIREAIEEALIKVSTTAAKVSTVKSQLTELAIFVLPRSV